MNNQQMDSLDQSIINLVGRSNEKNESSILQINDHLPICDQIMDCNNTCSIIKNEIQKRIFMRHPLANLNEMNVGTLTRQMFPHFMDFFSKASGFPNCLHCGKIAQEICLENGSVDCKDGAINMTGIMEKMKFAYHSATYKDLMDLQVKLLGANVTYSTNVYSENKVKFY